LTADFVVPTKAAQTVRMAWQRARAGKGARGHAQAWAPRISTKMCIPFTRHDFQRQNISALAYQSLVRNR
jgi:hypothetical protein